MCSCVCVQALIQFVQLTSSWSSWSVWVSSSSMLRVETGAGWSPPTWHSWSQSTSHNWTNKHIELESESETCEMSLLYDWCQCFCTPRSVKGLHVNFFPASKPSPLMVLSMVLGHHFPNLFGFTDTDVRGIFPCKEKILVETIKESGYMHIQATKPDTVGKDLKIFVAFNFV